MPPLSATVALDYSDAPGVVGWDFFKLLPAFRRDVLGTFESLWRQHGDTVHLHGLWDTFFFVHPQQVEQVLQTNQHNYPKNDNYKVLKSAIGNGMLISEGDSWLQQRRLAQPFFHRQSVGVFARAMTGETTKMLSGWRTGETREISGEMMQLALGIAGWTLFGKDLSGASKTIADSWEVIRHYLMRRTLSIIKWPESLPLPHYRRYRRALGEIDRIVYQLIAEQRQAKTGEHNLLSMLVQARDDETGAQMDDQQLRDEVITMLGASHETTALALTWTFYLLSQHPEAEEKLRAELAATLGGRVPEFADLPQLSYTRMVFEEAMRLYPPVWILARKSLAADDIGGYRIPANAEIYVFPYLTHRHAEFWERPEEFYPEHFTPEAVSGRPRFAYFPFAGGPRRCLGEHFAMMEGVLALATVLQRFRLSLVSGHQVAAEASITLRPRFGLQMVLHEA